MNRHVVAAAEGGRARYRAARGVQAVAGAREEEGQGPEGGDADHGPSGQGRAQGASEREE